jgi:hypothetical protein
MVGISRAIGHRGWSRCRRSRTVRSGKLVRLWAASDQIGYGGTRGRRVGRWRLYLRRVRTGPERSWLQAEILSLRREVECRPGSPSDGAKHLDQLAASHHKKPISSDLARDREAVKEAARLYNEGITNGFLRLSLFRRHQHQLLLNGTLALLATLVVLTIAAGDLEAKGKVLGWQSCWLAILLGILGAITSAAQRATRVPQQRIRNELGAISASLSRVPIGAAAGLTVWLFSMATSDSTSLDAANMFLAALAPASLSGLSCTVRRQTATALQGSARCRLSRELTVLVHTSVLPDGLSGTVLAQS